MDVEDGVHAVGLQRLLGAIFLVGSIGTAAELLLMGHFEDAWQLTPLVLIGLGCVMLAAVAVRPSGLVVGLFQATMVAFLAGGILGTGLHFQGNVDFELEMQPGAGGLPLLWEAMRGATPALAPGTMMLLGAIGLAYSYRR